MLGNSATVSRPRPPAQSRKSSSTKAVGSSPPPPYASSFTVPAQNKQERGEESRSTILGSPVSAVLQMITQDMPDSNLNRTPFDDSKLKEWLKGKSHDELSELLIRADETIKKRETDLNRTHTLCRSLFEDNTSLQSKHKTLFSKLPSTPPRRRSESPTLSPAHSTFSAFSSSSSKHYPSPGTDSLIRTPPVSQSSSDHDPFYSPSPSRFSGSPFKHRDRHVRKISVTPHDIALLSEQNTELLLKVEKLESESASQDLAGRRLLRKLEKEITALRDELDVVREKEALSSMKAQESTEREQKRERRKVQKMKKSKSGPVSFGTREGIDLGEDTVRDFAPAGPLTGLFHCSTDQVPETISETFEDNSGSEPDVDTPTSSASFEEQQREFIAQVLKKMAELEETNARLEAQQAETAAQLVAIQKETDSLGRVYEGLEGFVGAGEGFEIVHDDLQDESTPHPENDAVQAKEDTLNPNPSDSTIRFRSFKRTLEGLPLMPLEDFSLLNASSTQFQTHRSRKTVMGLFEETSVSEIPSNRLSLPADGRASPTPSTLSVTGLGLNTLDSFTPRDQTFLVNETLSTELGLDATGTGFTWDGPSDHLRTSSLYDFSTLSRQASFTPSPSPSPIGFHKTARPDMLHVGNREGDWSTEMHRELPKTPVKADMLQLTLEPPTPQLDDEPSPAQKRYLAMSQTVRARTARWVDGRFTDNVLSPSACGSVRGKRPTLPGMEETEIGVKSVKSDSSPLMSGSDTPSVGTPKTIVNPSPTQPIPLRLATVLDSVVEKFVGRQAGGSGQADESSKDKGDNVRPREGDNSVELFVAPLPPVKEKKAAGFGEIVLEIWLWLQFAVIILVFLWAMAKKGPKSVLGDRRHSAAGVRGP